MGRQRGEGEGGGGRKEGGGGGRERREGEDKTTGYNTVKVESP